MNIVQTNLGLLPIPPNGWGAVEKIIWEYHCELEKRGYNSEIKYFNEILNNGPYDIIHSHVANLCNMAHENGLNYIFSIHDHHVYIHGRDSFTYKENLKAIDNSLVTLVPCHFLIDYYGHHPKMVYFNHGVNTDFFKPKDIDTNNHKLLCVANNGIIGNNAFDRKGFSYAINAAKILNLPITIAGPSNNKNFFESLNQEYDKLTILYDLNEKELLDLYQSNTIFLSPSILEAGQPNLTLLEAMACGLPVVATYENYDNPKGIYKVERNVNQIVNAVNNIIKNYNQYRNYSLDTANEFSYKNVVDNLISIYNKFSKTKTNMKDQLIDIYENTPIRIREKAQVKNRIDYSFVQGAKVEILGDEQKEYKIEFKNKRTGKIEYETTLKNNYWCRASAKYFIEWEINVYEGNKLIDSKSLDLNGKRVYIALESSAVGDTIAWFPYVEEFRKEHNCEVVVSTFHNDWFEKTYPNLKFIKPGAEVFNLEAFYRIGWYYTNNNEVDYSMNPTDFRLKSLQSTATSILGLDNYELKPYLHVENNVSNAKNKYVVIAPHASAHAKYWNYPFGWQEIIDYLKEKGFDVVLISHEKYGDSWHDSKIGGTLNGVIDKSGDIPMQERFTDILNADLFIGLGSGLSWVSWALNKKTVLISGFSETYSEFDCYRVINEVGDVCRGCFNKHRLDAGDWEWCPVHKNTDRMFECTKTITPKMVINQINKALGL
jgi:autotransporter strand-loop-strand O-heptosyltransferase